jgi:AcrR family transcriptional regulator
MERMESEFRTPKSAQTFEKILTTATELFRTRGFHAVTLRELASACDMGLGALYYYFRTKEELVLRFYARHSRQSLEAYQVLPDAPRALPEAVMTFTRLKLADLDPYHDLMRVVMREAIDPESILSPLHPTSAPVLHENIALFQEMVEASGTARGREALELARGLWVGQMALLLYWLHDRSPGREATGSAIRVYGSAVRLATLRLPLLSVLRRQILDLITPLFER